MGALGSRAGLSDLLGSSPDSPYAASLASNDSAGSLPSLGGGGAGEGRSRQCSGSGHSWEELEQLPGYGSRGELYPISDSPELTRGALEPRATLVANEHAADAPPAVA